MRAAFDAVLPDAAVRRALSGRQFDHPVTLFAIGKAGWRMARAAYDALGAAQVRQGVVITKYQHSEGPIGNLEIYEAAHPLPDENGVAAARRAMDMAQSLTSADTAILLISGGGSALFECPYAGVTLSDIARTSLSLWVMIIIALPCSFIFLKMANSFSVSCGVSTAVGSSRISTLTSR